MNASAEPEATMPMLSQDAWDDLIERWNQATTEAERTKAARECHARGHHRWAMTEIGWAVCIACCCYRPGDDE